MTKKNFILFLVFNLFFAFALIGCGSNLFKSLNLIPSTSTGSVESLDDILDNAKSGDTESYAKVKESAQKIISSNATNEVKSQAHFLLGEAILGESNITLTNIASEFTDTKATSNLITKLISNATGNVTLGANSLNEAAALGTLDKNQEITRGLANTVAVIDVLSNYYEVKPDGSLGEPVSSTKNIKQNIQGLVNDGVLTYANKATEAFNKANTLTSDQKTETNKVEEKSEKIASLNKAINGTGAYTYTSGGSTVTVNSSSSDTDINTALNAIFK